ncbi:hypothetical protein CIRG_02474 [Coccidioides immitis RMSCC 2394]|uniref:Response regulatory domain-containing protein n=1 Tax=Coccidioides immitis RMSCC 2394 TaxID=404692 RepID=A0A0J7AZ69_COCIT|nr:hypothetical protein CIRG_02474 [Coccidioides immitis RMSCC 2394]
MNRKSSKNENVGDQRQRFQLAGNPVSIRQISDEIDIWMNNIMKETRSMCPSSGLPPQYCDPLDTICRNMSRLFRAKNNLMDCLLAQANELTLRPSRCQFRGYMIPTFRELWTIAAKKGVDVAYEVDHSIPEYLVYEAPRLRQVLFNLISNAIARTKKGQVKVTARTSSGSSASDVIELEFSVTNARLLERKGCGPASYQSYRRISDSMLEEWTDATGLTQAVTHQLIQLMDGRIWETAAEHDHGSVLHFSVTVKRDIPNLARMTSDISKYEDNRILIVDDIANESDQIQGMLEAFPLNTLALNPEDIVSSEDGRWPPKLHPKTPFEAIIVNSVDVLHNIRAIPLLNATPTILSSSAEFLDLAPLLKLDPSTFCISCRNQADLGYSIHSAFDSLPLPAGAHILAVEPDNINRLLFKKLLGTFDTLESTVCENGQQAYELFTREKYDVVFLEITGPEAHGEETAKKMRIFEREGAKLPTPLIALAPRSFQASGISLPEVFDGYVEIPIWKKDLTRTIINWIRKFRSPDDWA